MDDFGPFGSAIFKSEQFDTQILERNPDSSYSLSLLIPIDSLYYPSVLGEISIFIGSKEVGETQISFNTKLDYIVFYDALLIDQQIHFNINISHLLPQGLQPVSDSLVFVDIFRNQTLYTTLYFIKQDFEEHSKFTLSFHLEDKTEYYYEFMLVDDFNPEGLFLFSYSFKGKDKSDNISDDSKILINGLFITIPAMIIGVISVIGVDKIGNKIKILIRNNRSFQNNNINWNEIGTEYD